MILAGRYLLGAATLTLALLGATSAPAQQPPPSPSAVPEPASPPTAASPSGTPSLVSGQALYDDATAEMDAGSYASACPKLEEVVHLVPEGLGARITLAACYEGLGRLASAWSQYALVEALATRSGQNDRARSAAAKVAELKPKLALLTVTVPPAVRGIAGLVITRDGRTVGEAQWGVAIPVDVGRYEVVASAPRRSAWRTVVEVKTDGEQVVLEVQAPVAPAPQAPGIGARGEGGGQEPAGRVADAGGGVTRQWQRPFGIAAAGLGLLGIGAGALLGGMALDKFWKSNDGHCNKQDRCDSVGLDLREQAVVLGDGSTVAFVVGGVLAAGGVVLWVTAPVESAEGPGKSHRASRRSGVGLMPGGLVVQTTW